MVGTAKSKSFAHPRVVWVDIRAVGNWAVLGLFALAGLRGIPSGDRNAVNLERGEQKPRAIELYSGDIPFGA